MSSHEITFDTLFSLSPLSSPVSSPCTQPYPYYRAGAPIHPAYQPYGSPDNLSIEESFNELLQIANARDSNRGGIPHDTTSNVYHTLYDPLELPEHLPSRASQGLPEVVYVAHRSTRPGETVLLPMVPILKEKYNNVDEFQKREGYNGAYLLTDDTLQRHHSMRFPVPLPFEYPARPEEPVDPESIGQYFNLDKFVNRQQNKPANPGYRGLVDDHASIDGVNGLSRQGRLRHNKELPNCAAVDFQRREEPWARAIYDPEALRLLLRERQYPNPQDPHHIVHLKAVAESAENNRSNPFIEVWFENPNGKGFIHSVIVLSDRYMLVPLDSRTVQKGPVPLYPMYSSMDSKDQPQQKMRTMDPSLLMPPSPVTGRRRTTTPRSSPLSSPLSSPARNRQSSQTVQSPKKPSSKAAKAPAAVARKSSTQPSVRTRLIGPSTRANASSERLPREYPIPPNFDMDVGINRTPTSSSSSVFRHGVVSMNCWLSGCRCTFRSLSALQDHYLSEHRGHSGTVRCPFRGCDSEAKKIGDMKRHMGRARHADELMAVGGQAPVTNRCDIVGCNKAFSRMDVLKRHRDRHAQGGVQDMRMVASNGDDSSDEDRY